MLDKNVGDALLKLDLSPQTEPPTTQIERIIDADQRRVVRWTRISIALWIVAALGAVFIFVTGSLTFPTMVKVHDQERRAKMAAASANLQNGADVKKAIETIQGSLEDANKPLALLAKLVAACIVIGTASFVALVFAGLATVLLLLRSRTATLRQINANLLQISEHLKRKPTGGAQPAP